MGDHPMKRVSSTLLRIDECCFSRFILESMDEIREASNKSWILGSDYFKEIIKDKINRLINLPRRNGDRKSKVRKIGINRV